MKMHLAQIDGRLARLAFNDANDSIFRLPTIHHGKVIRN
jgi:hypothetical protein